MTAQTGYDGFGNATNSAFPTRYQFTGKEFDSFAKLQYSRARFYNPKLGRFISEDPIGFNGGDINLYGYVRNQPFRYRDPMGLQTVAADPNVWRLGAAGLAAAGIAAPPLGIAAVGGAAIYVASDFGNTMASHPSNPFVNGPWNPFGKPIPALPPYTPSQPYCQPLPRSIPFERSDSIPMPTPDREGCKEEISECLQICAEAAGDFNQPNVYGGSLYKCMQGCLTDTCRQGTRWE